MLNEFKKFAMRGNVIDLAVGVVLGTAFGPIVTSLVNDVIMPPFGVMLGGLDFSNYFVTLGPGEFDSLTAAKEAGVATLAYGKFINTIVNFLIIAFSIFMVIRQLNKLAKKEEDKPGVPATPPRQEMLLEEIRDLLKAQKAE
ncbi:MAG: large conductance mechanosensitive channel protein MscL [Alphaproteobacteria bacterium]|nr:large conductance mechanosensitive channel protein MscL [Alphaproteobacteria bacterium]